MSAHPARLLRRLLYAVTALSLLAFIVAAALRERNCPPAAFVRDSGIGCDYTPLERVILYLTPIAVLATLVVLCGILARAVLRAIEARRRQKTNAGGAAGPHG